MAINSVVYPGSAYSALMHRLSLGYDLSRSKYKGVG